MLAFEDTKHNVIISMNHLQKYCFIPRYFKSRTTQNNIDTWLKVLGIVSNENFRYRPSLQTTLKILDTGNITLANTL